MRKNSSWKKKHALKSLKTLPAKLSSFAPTPESQSTSGFVFRLPTPPCKLLWWNINSSLDSRKAIEKQLETLPSPWERPSEARWVSVSRKVIGYRGRKSPDLHEGMMNLSSSQEKPVGTRRWASLHLLSVCKAGKHGNPKSPSVEKGTCLIKWAVWVQRSHAAEEWQIIKSSRQESKHIWAFPRCPATLYNEQLFSAFLLYFNPKLNCFCQWKRLAYLNIMGWNKHGSSALSPQKDGVKC